MAYSPRKILINGGSPFFAGIMTLTFVVVTDFFLLVDHRAYVYIA